jgi:hypothetical protein
MSKRRAFCPTALSPLEARVVQSHVGLAPAALVHPVHDSAAPVPVQVLALNGTLSGTFITTLNSLTNPGAGTTTIFEGSGTVTGLGKVKVTGSLTTLVSATGLRSTVETFTLSAAQGSVTIQLAKLGTTPGTPSTAQSSFSIVKATGAFTGDIGAGTAKLQTIAEVTPEVPPTVARGVFTLTLSSNPTVL